MRRPKRRTTIGGQFAPRLIEMLVSPAFMVLGLTARRVLDRIEIELANHGGTRNGRLPVTYGDFVRYGIDRQAIAPALREVQALGFAEITERGRPSKSDFGRHPNLFRLTYLDGEHGEKPTHEWRQHKSMEQAAAAAKIARAAKDEKAVTKSKNKARSKTAAGGGETSVTGGRDHPVRGPRPGRSNPPTVTGGTDHPTVYISGREDAA